MLDFTRNIEINRKKTPLVQLIPYLYSLNTSYFLFLVIFLFGKLSEAQER